MSHLSVIDINIHELQTSYNLIENSIHALNGICEEIIGDFTDGQKSLKDAITLEIDLNKTSINYDELNGFSENMKKIAIKECKSLEEKLKFLIKLGLDCKSFMELETKMRDKFTVNMNEFNEDTIRQMLTVADVNDDDLQSNDNLRKFKNISGKLDGTSREVGDDLMIDNDVVQSHAQKCPITSKAIEIPFTNNCGHSYEKAATIQYLKTKNGKKAKCPIAGCQGIIEPNLLRQ